MSDVVRYCMFVGVSKLKFNISIFPFSDVIKAELVSVAEAAFAKKAPNSWVEAFEWRLEHMPDVTVFVAEQSAKIVGFKAGYATAYDRYYSWLGGVRPEYRRRGVASELMRRQHAWIENSRFRLLETQVSKSNSQMIAINEAGGFIKSGDFLKDGDPYLIFEKVF